MGHLTKNPDEKNQGYAESIQGLTITDCLMFRLNYQPEHLAKEYRVVSVEEFEEGDLPGKLYLVTLRKI